MIHKMHDIEIKNLNDKITREDQNRKLLEQYHAISINDLKLQQDRDKKEWVATQERMEQKQVQDKKEIDSLKDQAHELT